MVDKGKLKGQGTVKVIEEAAVPVKNGALVVTGSYGVVNILIGKGLSVVASRTLQIPSFSISL